ncbi:hypothetical protein [Deinococcus arcticus]|uniref:hypothetical protein n=1 Tax=Deinococcus arcticus TaxID=2136176 RepID=UPI0011B266B9|nr:hypothetical protein [Deinococcus arcticus]
MDETTGEIIGKGCFVDGTRHKQRLMTGGVPAESVIAITTLQYPPLADAELLNENAIFVAAARTDVPLLIAEVRRLQALLSEAQKGPKENPPTWEGLL